MAYKEMKVACFSWSWYLARQKV